MKPLFSWIALAWAFSAENALACATCVGAMPKRTLNAYFGMTVALSLLPLALTAGVAIWVAMHRRRSDRDAV